MSYKDWERVWRKLSGEDRCSSAPVLVTARKFFVDTDFLLSTIEADNKVFGWDSPSRFFAASDETLALFVPNRDGWCCAASRPTPDTWEDAENWLRMASKMLS